MNKNLALLLIPAMVLVMLSGCVNSKGTTGALNQQEQQLGKESATGQESKNKELLDLEKNLELDFEKDLDAIYSGSSEEGETELPW